MCAYKYPYVHECGYIDMYGYGHTGVEGGCLAFTPLNGYLKLWEFDHILYLTLFYYYHTTKVKCQMHRLCIWFLALWIGCMPSIL